MRSVADDLHEEDRREVAALEPAERVRLALALGRRDLEVFRRAHQPPLSRADAERLLDERRQAGRRPFRAPPPRVG